MMLILKIWLHICAELKKIFYKLIYGKKLKIGRSVTWRNNFNVMDVQLMLMNL